MIYHHDLPMMDKYNDEQNDCWMIVIGGNGGWMTMIGATGGWMIMIETIGGWMIMMNKSKSLVELSNQQGKLTSPETTEECYCPYFISHSHNSWSGWQPATIVPNLWTPPELTNQRRRRQVSSSASPECSPKPGRMSRTRCGVEKIASYKSFRG
ncbi:hypothetical protein CDAR_487571 [Caerostris darwini]|uniref:Uncharacterized protein n=1 Tax=Caerostris darwini TaxID=1538125 RepID=A0AAV4PUM8_9ARAC|nr:hypothetical protein CDAR_487571 [Caerostris darwini]